WGAGQGCEGGSPKNRGGGTPVGWGGSGGTGVPRQREAGPSCSRPGGSEPLCPQEPSLYTVKALLILDSRGQRLLAKYYDSSFPTAQEQAAFESSIFSKTRGAGGEIAFLEGLTVVYRSSSDLLFYVVGGPQENEEGLGEALAAGEPGRGLPGGGRDRGQGAPRGDGREPQLVEADLPAEAQVHAQGAVRQPRRPRRRRPRGQRRGGDARVRRPPGEDRGQEQQGQAREGLQLRPLQGEEEGAGDAGRQPRPLHGHRAGGEMRPGGGTVPAGRGPPAPLQPPIPLGSVPVTRRSGGACCGAGQTRPQHLRRRSDLGRTLFKQTATILFERSPRGCRLREPHPSALPRARCRGPGPSRPRR
uniref:Coatomer subunit zeta n=1 Tax=Anser brachyrhynchus TaxID=132585 RepID=A0A8B9B8Q7_9AVES